jgi:kelch-like protein 10
LFSSYEFNYYAAAVTLQDGSILITGGGSSKMVYHYKAGKLTMKASMLQIRKEHSSVYLGGYVYSIGGYDGIENKFLRSCERYNVLTNEWNYFDSVNIARCAFSASSVNNSLIFIFGGYDGTQRLDSIEKYDPEINKWEILGVTLRFPLSN